MNRYLKSIFALPWHARVVAVALLALLLIVLLLAFSGMISRYSDASQRLSSAEPRIARLLGYAGSVEALRESSEHISQRLAAATYPADADPASVSANAQQQVRRLIEAAGLRVSGSQVLGPAPGEGFQEVRIDLTANGSMADLDALLLALPEARPIILVRSIEVSPTPNRRNLAEQSLALSLRVSVLSLQ